MIKTLTFFMVTLTGLTALFLVRDDPNEPNHLTSGHSAVFNKACETEFENAQFSIPGGKVVLGARGIYSDETPNLIVEVAPFWIDVHEVTNAQFAKFVEATQYVTSAERAPELGFATPGSAVFSATSWRFVEGAFWRQPLGPGSTIEGKEHYPVVHISREDAEAYARWAGRRLPTEAEFEIAARSGLSNATYAWGEERVPGGVHQANTWQGVFPIADIGDDGHTGLAPVGCFPPNSFGLHDMIGNVWEWTSDPYFPDHDHDLKQDNQYRTIGYDPAQPDLPVGVIKGGSFLCAENFCRRYRPAARHPQDLALGTNHIGFRTAKNLETAE